MTDEEIGEQVRFLIEIVDNLVEGLASTGHPIPAENNKTFYLRCCWVLSWLNKAANRSHDDKVIEMKNTLTRLLPLIREAGV